GFDRNRPFDGVSPCWLCLCEESPIKQGDEKENSNMRHASFYLFGDQLYPGVWASCGAFSSSAEGTGNQTACGFQLGLMGFRTSSAFAHRLRSNQRCPHSANNSTCISCWMASRQVS